MHSTPLPTSLARRPSRRKLWLASTAALAASAFLSPARAQESGPLLDKLVEIGVLNIQQADEVKAKLSEEYKRTSASRLDLNSNVSKLGLFGDLRLRYDYQDRQNAYDQYDGAKYKSNVAGNPNAHKGDKILEPNGADNRDDVSRFRYRLRFGVKAQLDDFEFGLRLASAQLPGNDTVVSTNDTFGDAFGKDGIYIDQAYLKWEPKSYPWFRITGGKFDFAISKPLPIFYTTEMYWDNDVTVEGFAQNFVYTFNQDKTTVYLNLGQFSFGDVAEADEDVTGTKNSRLWVDTDLTVDSDGDGDKKNDKNKKSAVTHNASGQVSNDDGWVFAFQLGAKHELTPTLTGQAAVGFWYWANAGDLSTGQKTASGISSADKYTSPGSGNNIGSEFEIVDFLGSLVWKPSSGILSGKPVELYTHLAYNLAPAPNLGVTDKPGPNTQNVITNGDDVTRFNGAHYNDVDGFVDLSDMFAWRVGLRVGEAKKQGQWQIDTYYQQVGSDAVPDTFNDSEIAAGFTNHKGFALKGTYAIRDYLTLALNFYNFDFLDPDIAQELNNGNTAQSRILNLDLTVKF